MYKQYRSYIINGFSMAKDKPSGRKSRGMDLYSMKEVTVQR